LIPKACLLKVGESAENRAHFRVVVQPYNFVMDFLYSLCFSLAPKAEIYKVHAVGSAELATEPFFGDLIVDKKRTVG
jgi:hypothetical protein